MESSYCTEENVTGRLTCPVCASPYTAYLRQVPTLRTRRQINLYGCFSCKSFWCPSGYKEDERQLQMDIEWHDRVSERNSVAGVALFELLKNHGVLFNRVLEVGCGAGSLVKVAVDAGLHAVGFDVNQLAIKHGRAKYGVDLRDENWTAEYDLDFDLILCISVLEHINQPRVLIEEIAKACRRRGAVAYISVPFLDENAWPFLLDPDPLKPGTPFFDNDVHVVHFSSEGLKICLTDFGAIEMTKLSPGLWSGYLVRF